MSMRSISIGLGVVAATTLGTLPTAPAQAFSLHSPVVVENLLRVETVVEGKTTLRDIRFQGPTETVVAQNALQALINQSAGQISDESKPAITISPDEDDQAPNLVQFGGIWNIYLYNNPYQMQTARPQVRQDQRVGTDSVYLEEPETTKQELISVWFDLNSRFGNVISGQDVYSFLAPDFKGSIRRFDVTLRGDFAKAPEIIWLARNKFEVVFPLGFAPGSSPNLTAIPGELGLQIDLVVDPTPVPSPALLPGLIGMALAALRQRRDDPPQASLGDEEAASGERTV